ncbi:hypothetical protein [Bradyrhizobium sp.]
MAVVPPPVIEDFTDTFKRSGRWYLSIGVIIVLIGISIIGVGLAGGVGADTANFVKLGGGLLSSSSLVPFKMGWYRFERISYLALLRARWAQVAQAGDPGGEIPELNRMFLKVIQDSLGQTA